MDERDTKGIFIIIYIIMVGIFSGLDCGFSGDLIFFFLECDNFCPSEYDQKCKKQNRLRFW